jgi:hypothetical protein
MNRPPKTPPTMGRINADDDEWSTNAPAGDSKVVADEIGLESEFDVEGED